MNTYSHLALLFAENLQVSPGSGGMRSSFEFWGRNYFNELNFFSGSFRVIPEAKHNHDCYGSSKFKRISTRTFVQHSRKRRWRRFNTWLCPPGTHLDPPRLEKITLFFSPCRDKMPDKSLYIHSKMRRCVMKFYHIDKISKCILDDAKISRTEQRDIRHNQLMQLCTARIAAIAGD